MRHSPRPAHVAVLPPHHRLVAPVQQLLRQIIDDRPPLEPAPARQQHLYANPRHDGIKEIGVWQIWNMPERLPCQISSAVGLDRSALASCCCGAHRLLEGFLRRRRPPLCCSQRARLPAQVDHVGSIDGTSKLLRSKIARVSRAEGAPRAPEMGGALARELLRLNLVQLPAVTRTPVTPTSVQLCESA